jgi:hypothetical protein
MFSSPSGAIVVFSSPKLEGGDRPGPTYENLRSLWESRYIGLVGSNEETTRREFIEHVMPGLGFARFSNLSLTLFGGFCERLQS